MTGSSRNITEDVLRILQAHILDFQNHEKEIYNFIERQDEHLERARDAMEKVTELHSAITTYVPQLRELTSIASTLQNMERAVMKQNSDLILPATTAEKMPTKIAIVMLGICFTMLIILGSALILVLIRDSKKNLSIGGKDGLNITNNEAATTESQNHFANKTEY